VTAIVRRQLETNPNDAPPVVVVSAMSKVTDRLIESGRLAGQGDGEEAAQLLQDLLDRHVTVASALVPGDASRALVSVLRQAFGELTTMVRALAAIGDVPPASHDAIVAMGELA